MFVGRAVFWSHQAQAFSTTRAVHRTLSRSSPLGATRISSPLDNVHLPTRKLPILGHQRAYLHDQKGTSGGPSVSAGAGVKENDASLLFGALPVHADTKRAISEVMGYTHMTSVQARTLPVITEGFDVLAKVWQKQACQILSYASRFPSLFFDTCDFLPTCHCPLL
jgi:hypothetical protein